MTGAVSSEKPTVDQQSDSYIHSYIHSFIYIPILRLWKYKNYVTQQMYIILKQVLIEIDLVQIIGQSHCKRQHFIHKPIFHTTFNFLFFLL